MEDDALLARVLGEALSGASFDVQVVENGLMALDAAKKFEPNLILLDLILPGLDGFEILRQFKFETNIKDVPVIVLSNLGDPGDIKSVKALGAEDYFIKANTNIKQIVHAIQSRLHM